MDPEKSQFSLEVPAEEIPISDCRIRTMPASTKLYFLRTEHYSAILLFQTPSLPQYSLEIKHRACAISTYNLIQIC